MKSVTARFINVANQASAASFLFIALHFTTTGTVNRQAARRIDAHAGIYR